MKMIRINLLNLIFALFIVAAFIPYINFGLRNPLTTQGELTYFYLIFAVSGIILLLLNRYKTRDLILLAIISVPILVDFTISIIISDFKNALKLISIFIISSFTLLIHLNKKRLNLLKKGIFILLIIHVLFSMMNIIYPVPPWYSLINFGPQRGDVLTYLQHTAQMGKFIRGLNTEPGTNINIILLLLNLYFLIKITDSRKKEKLSILLTLSNIFFVIFVKALRMIFLLPVNLLFFILMIFKSIKKSTAPLWIFILFSTLGIVSIGLYYLQKKPSYSRLINFIQDPVYSIKHDPSIALHLEKFFGKTAPSGFSEIFIYNHFGILIYFILLIILIIRYTPFSLPFTIPVTNLIIVALFSALIASYHSPYNIISLLLTLKILTSIPTRVEK